MNTHKAFLALAMLFLLFIFPAPVLSKPSDSIVVNNADTVRQASVSVSQDLLDLTDSVGPRIAVQFVDLSSYDFAGFEAPQIRIHPHTLREGEEVVVAERVRELQSGD